MTTSGIGSLVQNAYAGKTQSTSKSEETKGEGKVKGDRPPPPPKANQDTYVPSEEGLAALVETADEVAAEETTEESGDSATSSEKTYEKDTAMVDQLKMELAANEQQFINDMVSMINGQASDYISGFTNLSDLIGSLDVSADMQAQAAEAVSEDGYWGAEQTATRIVDMAKALVGGDPDRAEEMMAAIEKGFEAAEDVWGGELPSITQDTKAIIDTMFDEWKSGEA